MNLPDTISQICSSKKIFFAKLTGKQQFWSPFLNKVAVQRPATLLKKRLLHRIFSVNYKILIDCFCIEDVLQKKCFEKFLDIFGEGVVVESFSVTLQAMHKYFFCTKESSEKKFSELYSFNVAQHESDDSP